MSVQVQVRFPADELSALDDCRRAQRNPPSRPQAIRELARAGLMNGKAMKFDDQHPNLGAQ
jgi:hypothetical protein